MRRWHRGCERRRIFSDAECLQVSTGCCRSCFLRQKRHCSGRFGQHRLVHDFAWHIQPSSRTLRGGFAKNSNRGASGVFSGSERQQRLRHIVWHHRLYCRGRLRNKIYGFQRHWYIAHRSRYAPWHCIVP